MKKAFLLVLVAFVAFGCSKEDKEKKEDPANRLIGTKWTAVDSYAELVYGKTCTTSIEFLDEKRCQTINVRKTRYGAGTDIIPGIYKIQGNNVLWSDKEDDKTLNMKGEISGSVIITNLTTTSFKKRIYTKE